MKQKRTRLIVLVICMLLFAVVCFAGCNSNKRVDIRDYSDDNLNDVGHLVQWLHNLVGVGNYGWAVVIFTVFLKVIMLPLDLWQRYSTRKSTEKMKRMQFALDKIDKQYGANTQRANEEKQKLYQKNGVSTFSSCLPMIITMVVFFVMFGGLTSYSTYKSATNYKELYVEYYNAEYDKVQEFVQSGVVENNEDYVLTTEQLADADNLIDWKKIKIDNFNTFVGVSTNTSGEKYVDLVANAGKVAVQEKYLATREGWLWIQNIWQPDTWEPIMANYQKVNGVATIGGTVDISNLGSNATAVYDTIKQAVWECTAYGKPEKGNWNGLMILPLLSIALSFLSIWVSQQMEKKHGATQQQTEQQAATSKSMMIMMPLLMAFFGFKYTGAFAVYMVVNYSLSILSTVLLRAPVEKMVAKSMANEDAKKNSGKASYMR